MIKAKIMFKTSKKKCKKIVEALKPETRFAPTPRSKTKIKNEGNVVEVTFYAKDFSALRASINSFCRWVKMVDEVLEVAKDLR
ncbi:MAG: KEOPS complex subunit Pcc1 [Candidatus Bathyarchaeota archaeon]|nr:KEOPS complex subunit Pcc1 [Candidatus Bathyarchaeota archaeon]